MWLQIKNRNKAINPHIIFKTIGNYLFKQKYDKNFKVFYFMYKKKFVPKKFFSCFKFPNSPRFSPSKAKFVSRREIGKFAIKKAEKLK
jgi:hypothetical protein